MNWTRQAPQGFMNFRQHNLYVGVFQIIFAFYAFSCALFPGAIPLDRRLRQLIQDEQVRVEVHEVVPNVGVKGQVFVGDLDVGAQMVAEGLALAVPAALTNSPRD